ncbi:MAG: tetratricopeptide repeat protein [Candidatus Edwardsbacteria bacterium]
MSIVKNISIVFLASIFMLSCAHFKKNDKSKDLQMKAERKLEKVLAQLEELDKEHSEFLSQKARICPEARVWSQKEKKYITIKKQGKKYSESSLQRKGGPIKKQLEEFIRKYPESECSIPVLFFLQQVNSMCFSSTVEQRLEEQKRTIASKPGTVEASLAQLMIGLIYGEVERKAGDRILQDYERGIEEFRKVVEQYPNSPYCIHAKMLIGGYYLRQWKDDKAIAVYNQVLKEYPESIFLPTIHHILAEVYSSRKEWENCKREKEILLKEYPSHPLSEGLADEIQQIDEELQRQKKP